MLQYFWPHIILDTCTQYIFNIICKKHTTPIRSTRTEEAHHQTLPKASPNSETPPSKRQRKACKACSWVLYFCLPHN
jgi:hypothetical protein